MKEEVEERGDVFDGRGELEVGVGEGKGDTVADLGIEVEEKE